MSAGIKTIFICSNCDAQFPKWSGRCLECCSWGTLNSGVPDAKSEKKEAAKKLGGATVLDFNSIPDTALA